VAAPALVAALREEPLRPAAALALKAQGSAAAAAVPELAVFLKDKDAELAASAATILGGMGPAAASAAPALQEAAASPEPLLREAAAQALKRVSGRP
jgi:HEAT repeat protein